MKTKLVGFIAMMLVSGAVAAEDFPGASSDAEFEKGFDKDQGMSQQDKDSADADRVKWGGTLWSEFQYYQLSSTSTAGVTTTSPFFSPHSLWLYLDARLKNDVRGVVKLKTVYDPTASGAVNPLTGTATYKTVTDLEEMKLLFSVDKKVFFTVGKQKMKWGSGKYWNPTDFLNSSERNFLYTTDLRSGVPLLKTHVPLGASNLYLLQSFENASELSKIRHAIRVEVPVGPAEVSASATVLNGTNPAFGIDLSTALWDFDVYGELAYSAGNQKTFYSATGSSNDFQRAQLDWVAGLSYDIGYADNDTLTLGAEYFNNGLGYSQPSSYAWVFAGGGYQAFHLSRQYGMILAYLPKPGTWDRVTFTLLNIANLTDFSAMTRVDVLYELLDELSLNVAVGVHYGNGDGELKYGGQLLDFSARLMVTF